MIEIISGVWAAGETKTFHINGEYLEILEAQYPCDVMLMDRQGAQLSIMRSSEASFFSRPKEGFNSVQITSAQAQTIRIFVGSGDAGTRRISSTVSVIDGGRARSNAGTAFGGCASISGVAAKYTAVQLWNPAGSGKNVIVNQLSSAANAAGNIYLVPSFAALSINSSTRVANKKLVAGGGAGSAQLYLDNLAALPVSGATPVLIDLAVAANQLAYWKPTEPVLVPPGAGLTAVHDIVATQLFGNFEWFEEAI